MQRQQDTPGAKTRPRATLTTALEWTEVGLQHYDRATSRWTRLDLSTLPDRAPHFTDSTSTLRLMTYNTYSCDPSHTQSQTRALLAVLEQARADIIALQEVSDGFFRALQNWAARHSTSRRKDGGHEWVMTAAQDFWHAAGPNAAKGPRRKKGQREACLLLLRRGLVGTGSTVRIGRLDKAKDEGGKAALALSLVSDGQEKVSCASSHPLVLVPWSGSSPSLCPNSDSLLHVLAAPTRHVSLFCPPAKRHPARATVSLVLRLSRSPDGDELCSLAARSKATAVCLSWRHECVRFRRARPPLRAAPFARRRYARVSRLARSAA